MALPAGEEALIERDMTMNMGREARRFRQIAALERGLAIKEGEIRDAKEHVTDLNKEREGILLELRAVARDEGELPLIDMMEEVAAGTRAS